MITNKPTVTIGIPAYNEQVNIGNILTNLLDQECQEFTLEKIVVSSDGSSDSTNRIVQRFSVKHPQILLINNQVRNGQASRQNQIINQTKSDILVLLNADVLIKDRIFIKKLITPIINNIADLTSSNLLALKPRTYIGKILFTTLQFRNKIYRTYRNGQNLYTCHGAARAFSRNIYTLLVFKNSVAEDAYSYLFCISQGFKYAYVPEAITYIRWPETIIDNQRQSIRFFQSKKILKKDFGKKLVDDQYRLPLLSIIIAILVFYVRYPVYALVYTVIFWIAFIRSHLTKPLNNWQISPSSKKLI